MKETFYLKTSDGRSLLVAHGDINDLIKQLRDKRHELGLEVVAPTSTVPERVYSLDGHVVAGFSSNDVGAFVITLADNPPGASEYPADTIVLDGRQETALFQVLKERKMQRDPNRAAKVRALTGE